MKGVSLLTFLFLSIAGHAMVPINSEMPLVNYDNAIMNMFNNFGGPTCGGMIQTYDIGGWPPLPGEVPMMNPPCVVTTSSKDKDNKKKGDDDQLGEKDENGLPVNYPQESLEETARITNGILNQISSGQVGKMPMICRAGGEVLPLPTLPSDTQWKPGCEVLNGQISEGSRDQLMQCLSSIKQLVMTEARVGSSLSNSKMRQVLKTRLNSKERQFAALVFTAYGEARGTRPAVENQMMVMKVIENRVRHAREQQGRNPDEMDIALQPMQFSMYNSNDPNWRTMFDGPLQGNQGFTDAVNAFIGLSNCSFSPAGVADNIYHYHTPALRGSVNWSNGRSPAPMTVNGQPASAHLWYAGVPWAYNGA
ncbi:MAG: hypothetical protein OHK0056_22300 [Bacteriovoracaceae bacterium]